MDRGGPLYAYRCSERKVENAFREYKTQAIRGECRVNDPWPKRC